MHMPPSLDEIDDGEVLLEELVVEEFAPTTLRQPFGLTEPPEVPGNLAARERSGPRMIFRAAGILIGLGVGAIVLAALGRRLAPRPRFAWLRFGS